MSELLKLLLIQLAQAYLKIVTQRHGVFTLSLDDIKLLSEEELTVALHHLSDLVHA